MKLSRHVKYFIFTSFYILITIFCFLSNGYSQIEETILPNGLKVLTKEVHTSPIVSVWVWYKVGSRNETDNISGISHMIEHMLFKSTKKFKGNEAAQLIIQTGGSYNGFTSYDYTAYYSTVPSEYIDLALEIEAERMSNAVFDKDELEAERNVILSELDGDENDPNTILAQTTRACAFISHPYRRPIIGYRNVVKEIKREELINYYQKYYVPNNAILVIVGDFDTKEILKKVNKYFSKIKRKELPHPLPIEHEQKGEKRIYIKEEANVPGIYILYPIPEFKHKDYYAISVLDDILSYGEHSRLYKALVEKNLATSVFSSTYAGFDLGWWSFYITPKENVQNEVILKALEECFESLKKEFVKDEEIQKIKNQIKSSFAYISEDITHQAYYIGYYVHIKSLKNILKKLIKLQKKIYKKLQKSILLKIK
jgi:zinc protease